MNKLIFQVESGRKTENVWVLALIVGLLILGNYVKTI